MEKDMITPTVTELTKVTKANRYSLVIAAAKSARIITDEYVRQKDYAEKLAMSKESEKNKNIATLIKSEYRDDKAVELAVEGLARGDFRILSPEEAEELHCREEQRRKEEAEQKLAEEAAKAESARADLAAVGLLDDDEALLDDEDGADDEYEFDDDAFDDAIDALARESQAREDAAKAARAAAPAAKTTSAPSAKPAEKTEKKPPRSYAEDNTLDLLNTYGISEFDEDEYDEDRDEDDDEDDYDDERDERRYRRDDEDYDSSDGDYDDLLRTGENPWKRYDDDDE